MPYKLFRFFASLILALVTTFAGYSPALAAPPANDNFADAEVIASLPFSASPDITESTAEPGESNNCPFSILSQTVWYSFTPTQTMSIRADIPSSAGNSLVNIYHSIGTGIPNLQFLGCVTDLVSFKRSFTFVAEVGHTYYLQVSPFLGGSGNIQFNLQQVLPPANDLFANAQSITSLPFSASPTITEAGIELGEPNDCGPQQRTVWYSFTPLQTLSVRVDTSGGENISGVGIYHAIGSGISNLQFLKCVGGGGLSFFFLVEAGQTYYLQVGAQSSSVVGSGTTQVNLQQVFPPANDFFANAEAITSLPFSTSTDITDTRLRELNEPLAGCGITPNVIHHTAWYSFTPTETMDVRADMLGGVFNSILSIYRATGIGISNLQLLGCADSSNSFTFSAEAGQTYYLQAGVFVTGGTGIIHVNLERMSPPTMEVGIDIKPGDRRNRIEIEREGEGEDDDDDEKISVAILSTEQFIAGQQVDRNSLTFGTTGDENSLNLKGRRRTPDCQIKDVNRDGLSDLVCKFKVRSTGFKFGDTAGILKGQTVDGLPIEGHDSVVIKMDD